MTEFWTRLWAFEESADKELAGELESAIDSNFEAFETDDERWFSRLLDPPAIEPELAALRGVSAIGVGYFQPWDPALASATEFFDWLGRGERRHVTPAGLDGPASLREVPLIMLIAALEIDPVVDGRFLQRIAADDLGGRPGAYLVVPSVALIEPRRGQIAVLDAPASTEIRTV